MEGMFLTAMAPVFAAFDIGSFLTNATSTIKGWGGLLIVALGIIMMIVGAVLAGKGLMSHGKSQTNWFVIGALILVGGAFAAGGFQFINDIGEGGKKTIEDLGNGSGVILPWIQMYLP